MTATTSQSLETLSINTIRGLAMDAVQAANSGHPGMPMGAAPMAYALWKNHLRHNPKDPKWFNRDRFILSAGHGSMLLYSLLHLTGYDLPLSELKNFRQLHSKTPGHPENFMTPGVEMATGPLGQGFATSVGFAMAEKFLAATFNRPENEIIDHYTYGICSDGDLMEGVSYEAASLAGHQKLGKLIYLYDSNSITIDGRTDLAFTENVEMRFRAAGWQVLSADGMDVEAVDQALKQAKANREQPTLIICRTIIGFGSPNKQDSSKSHGAALGPDEVALSKRNLGLPEDKEFWIPDEVKADFSAVEKGQELQQEWKQQFSAYEREFPEEAAQLRSAIAGEWGGDWLDALPELNEKLATRAASGKVINAIAPHLPTLIGGSADLAESNNTHQKGYPDFQAASPEGRNINFGVREHAMAAAVNGMSLHGGVKAYGASFLIFSDYCRPAIRLSALMGCPSLFIFTHDSIGLGEDGPTHQPIEHLPALRAIPNLNVMRPADGAETVACWKVALQTKENPCLMALTRQGLPPVSPTELKKHPAEKGAYILQEATGGPPEVILAATGSEVQLALAARTLLEERGTKCRVVSMPSWFLFENQAEAYRQEVLPKTVPTVSIEASAQLGWERYAQAHVAMHGFGASAPGDVLMKHFGFTADNVVQTALGLLGKS